MVTSPNLLDTQPSTLDAQMADLQANMAAGTVATIGTRGLKEEMPGAEISIKQDPLEPGIKGPLGGKKKKEEQGAKKEGK